MRLEYYPPGKTAWWSAALATPLGDRILAAAARAHSTTLQKYKHPDQESGLSRASSHKGLSRQKMTLRPSCSDLGEFAMPVILPKLGSSTFPLGTPRITVFGKLNDSARNSIDRFSKNGNCRKMEKSMFQNDDDRIAYRPRFPNLYAAGAANAALLNHA